MRLTLSTIAALISIVVLDCQLNVINGIYVFDKSTKEAGTTIRHQGHDEIVVDLNCMFTKFDFKGNSTVKIGSEGGDVVSSYVIDKDYVRIKGASSISY